MEFRIAERPDGQFDVIKSEPVVLATCAEHEIARKVLDFFVGETMEEMDTKPVVAKLVPSPVSKRASTPVPVEPVTLSPADPIMAKPHKVMPAPDASAKPTIPELALRYSDDDWTAADLEAAFVRMAKGEKLREIADSYGKDWRQLRSKWASLRKHYPDDITEPKPRLPAVVAPKRSMAEIVTSTVSEMKDQRPCTMCGRYFSITPERIDNCGRPDCAT